MAGDEGRGVPPPPGADLPHHVRYHRLSPRAARLFRLLGLHPAPAPGPGFGTGAAAAALDAGTGEAVGLLDELVAAHLVTVTAPGRRHRMDVDVHAYARRRAEREEGLAGTREAALRIVGWYLRTAAAADTVAIPGRWRLGPVYERPRGDQLRGERLRGEAPAYSRPGDALSALAEERANVAAAVRSAEEYGADGLVWQLCEALWALCSRLGHRQEWLAVHRAGVDAAVRCQDRRAEGRMRCQYGHALLATGRSGAAEAASEAGGEAEDEFRAAARADRSAGHPRGEAAAVASLGVLRLRQARYEDALQLFGAARDLAARAGDPRGPALLDLRTGQALLGLREYPGAERHLRAALEVVRSLPDRCDEARVRTGLGELYLAAGRPAEAVAPLDEALAALEDGSGPLRMAEAAALRGRCARELGHGDEPRFLRVAAECYRTTGVDMPADLRERLNERFTEREGPDG